LARVVQPRGLALDRHNRTLYGSSGDAIFVVALDAPPLSTRLPSSRNVEHVAGAVGCAVPVDGSLHSARFNNGTSFWEGRPVPMSVHPLSGVLAKIDAHPRAIRLQRADRVLTVAPDHKQIDANEVSAVLAHAVDVGWKDASNPTQLFVLTRAQLYCLHLDRTLHARPVTRPACLSVCVLSPLNLV
jgi:hypothetical protein